MLTYRTTDNIERPTAALQADVVLANAQYYRQIAHKYDSYEVCVRDPGLQAMLSADLDHIAQLLSPRARQVRCLDCGGGSGNLSLKMLARGWNVTVVDVSADMLGLLSQRARRLGVSPALVHTSIEEYFRLISDNFDVITFSSVLHHLYSYLTVVEEAADRIVEGGCFYSTFDPVMSERGSLRVALETLDTACAKAVHDRADFLPGIKRRLKKLFASPRGSDHRAVASLGDIAEYHARNGVTAEGIIEVLTAKDFSVVTHRQFPTARSWATRLVNDRLQLIKSFSIMAHRTGPASPATMNSDGAVHP